MIPFLESLGPCQCSGSTPRPIGHHKDDQEAQECPSTIVLMDFWCLDDPPKLQLEDIPELPGHPYGDQEV